MESGSVLHNRYRLVRPLGRGGMADVYLAFDEKRRAEVAIKLLREDLAEDPEFLRRFQREAEALARLDHPYIVRFYSLERQGSTAFIVMDYIAGTTLRSHLAEAAGPLPLAEVTSILRHIGSALQYAHNEGFVHRDIKPGNIMLRQDGSALLSDFGIARAAEASTMTQGALGTPAYMSPEQILGRVPDARTDVYALGIVLHEMLTGRRPFLGESGTGTSTSERVRDEHLHRSPPDPRLLNPSLPADLAGIVVKAMAKDPAERWQSVEEFVATWAAAAAPKGPEQAGETAAAPSAVPPTPVSRVPTAAILAAAGVVALMLLVIVGVGLASLRNDDRSKRSSSAGDGTTPTRPIATATRPATVRSAPTPVAPTAGAATPTARPTAGKTAPAATPTTTEAIIVPASNPTETLTPAATPSDTATPVPPSATPTATPTPTAPPTSTPTPACATAPDPELASMWDRDAMGCAQAPSAIVWSAWQSFQSGAMFWHSDTDTVSVFFSSGSYGEVYNKWDRVAVPPSRGDPPAGLYAPVRGFGYLWGTHDYIYSGLGWATEEEKGICALIQPFEGGYLLRSSTVEYCQDTLFNWARDPSFAPVAIGALTSGTWQRY